MELVKYMEGINTNGAGMHGNQSASCFILFSFEKEVDWLPCTTAPMLINSPPCMSFYLLTKLKCWNSVVTRNVQGPQGHPCFM